MKPIAIFVIRNKANMDWSILEFPVEVAVHEYKIGEIFQLHSFYYVCNKIEKEINKFSKVFILFEVQSISLFEHSCDHFDKMIKDNNITIYCKKGEIENGFKVIPGHYHPESIIDSDDFELIAFNKVRLWIDNRHLLD